MVPPPSLVCAALRPPPPAALRQAIIPSVLPAMISKRFSFFLVKPKRGHSNNTQGQWWEPASLPVIIHLFTELMTVAGGWELGASSHVMSPTHAKGLGGQAEDKKCGLYRGKNNNNSLYCSVTELLMFDCWSCDKTMQIYKILKLWQVDHL